MRFTTFTARFGYTIFASGFRLLQRASFVWGLPIRLYSNLWSISSDDVLFSLGHSLMNLRLEKSAIGWGLDELELAAKEAIAREPDSDDEWMKKWLAIYTDGGIISYPWTAALGKTTFCRCFISWILLTGHQTFVPMMLSLAWSCMQHCRHPIRDLIFLYITYMKAYRPCSSSEFRV